MNNIIFEVEFFLGELRLVVCLDEGGLEWMDYSDELSWEYDLIVYLWEFI